MGTNRTHFGIRWGAVVAAILGLLLVGEPARPLRALLVTESALMQGASSQDEEETDDAEAEDVWFHSGIHRTPFDLPDSTSLARSALPDRHSPHLKPRLLLGSRPAAQGFPLRC